MSPGIAATGQAPCPDFQHDFREEYYGWQCSKCGLFYAFGCAPWEDVDDEEEDDA